jgi:hypothetical protein
MNAWFFWGGGYNERFSCDNIHAILMQHKRFDFRYEQVSKTQINRESQKCIRRANFIHVILNKYICNIKLILIIKC